MKKIIKIEDLENERTECINNIGILRNVTNKYQPLSNRYLHLNTLISEFKEAVKKIETVLFILESKETND